MKRLTRILLAAVVTGLIPATVAAQGNTSASASQTIQLELHPVISISFTNTSSNTGAPVSMAVTNANDYLNGVQSGTQELLVRSNKSFKLSVQTEASTFAYSGSNNAPAMPVANTLFLAVTDNTTGGAVNNGFSNNFKSLSASAQDLVLNGQNGDDQKIVLAYKAKPGLNNPAGTYSVGVLYTATQP